MNKPTTTAPTGTKRPPVNTRGKPTSPSSKRTVVAASPRAKSTTAQKSGTTVGRVPTPSPVPVTPRRAIPAVTPPPSPPDAPGDDEGNASLPAAAHPVGGGTTGTFHAKRHVHSYMFNDYESQIVLDEVSYWHVTGYVYYTEYMHCGEADHAEHVLTQRSALYCKIYRRNNPPRCVDKSVTMSSTIRATVSKFITHGRLRELLESDAQGMRIHMRNGVKCSAHELTELECTERALDIVRTLTSVTSEVVSQYSNESSLQ